MEKNSCLKRYEWNRNNEVGVPWECITSLYTIFALEIVVLQRFGGDFGDFLFSMRKVACGKKAAPVPGCSVTESSEGGQQVEELLSWVGQVWQHFPCPFPHSGGVQVQAPVAFQLSWPSTAAFSRPKPDSYPAPLYSLCEKKDVMENISTFGDFSSCLQI